MEEEENKMNKGFRNKRTKLQKYTSWVLPAVIIGGWIYPPLGFLLLLCMVGAIGIAFYNGRAWCDWMCPRGSFYDLFLDKLSKKHNIPALFKTNWFRTVILSLLMTALGVQIYYAWGSAYGIGMAFVLVLTITTTAGIVLGAVYKPRAWCQICPMGTLANWISASNKKPLYVSEACKDCNLCAKVCPMQLKPYEHKASSMPDADCIKCGTCVAECPINALSFKEEMKEAA
jgi:polyferredoxin